MLETNKIINGDCVEKLKELPDNSVDAVITDPPYGLEFMGKDWDKFKEGHNIAGGDTGKDTPYARSKPAPSFYQLGNKDMNNFQQFTFNWATEVLRVLKPGGYLLSFGGTRTYHRMACGIEDAGFEIRDCIMWLYGSGFPKSLNIGKQIDKMQGNEREVVGEERCGKNAMMGGLSNTITSTGKIELTKGTSEWEGWGTALKPAVEPIVVARKPLSEKNVALNVLKFGTGGIHIDDCRIKFEKNDSIIAKNPHTLSKGTDAYDVNCYGKYNATQEPIDYNNSLGRFPANIILNRSKEQVYILKESFINLIPLLKSYYGNNYMFKLQEEVSNLQKQIESKQGKVLSKEMLSSMDEGKEKSDEWKETQQEINSKDDKFTQEYSKREEQQEIQGVLDEQRLQVSEQGRIDYKSEIISKPDDKEMWDSRTQNSNGNLSEKTIKEMGDSSSQEWNKERQQDREFGDDEQFNTQERTQRDTERIKAITKGERGFVVCDCDLPKEWREFFEPITIEIDYPFSSARMLDEQSGIKISKRSLIKGGFGAGVNTFGAGFIESERGFNDKGGASRFFYCAKASKSERNFGCDELEENKQACLGIGKICNKCGLTQRHAYEKENLDKCEHIWEEPSKKNVHPTVKPIKLMEYLIKLVTPKNAIILDPFLGSGTTAIACIKLGRQFIGIEKEAEYIAIANARIKKYLEQTKL